MVSKCANPECGVPFRYFHQGKLFRWETVTGLDRRRSMGANDETRKPIRRIEFYWLCENCAEKMTLVFEQGVGVSTRSNILTKAAGF